MAGKGADALFERVNEIAATLREAGEADSKDPKSFKTLAAIDSEGCKLRAKFEDKLPSRHRTETEPTLFGSHVAYLHNEFNFDVAYPVGGAALVTHISFVPFFPPQSTEPEAAPETHSVKLEQVSKSLANRLVTLRDRSVHAPDDVFDEKEYFFGGKDDIIHNARRFVSYDQPVITTMRSIERMDKFIRDKFAGKSDPLVQAATDTAEKWNSQSANSVAGQGLSSRGSMLREFMLRKYKLSELRLTWVRHHSHYQTLTAIEHADVAREPLPRNAGDSVFSESDRAAVPTLCELADDITRLRLDGAGSLVERTAFDEFPEGWADHLFGRYLQGANYLLLPLEWLFSDVHIDRVDKKAEAIGQSWRDECFRMLDLCSVPHARGQSKHITVEQFRQLWFAARGDQAKLREVSSFAFALLRPLIDVLFASPGSRRFEFVMCGAAEGAAIVLSDVRNFGRREERALMSATLIIDLAMNDYERGRLLKHLTEFSTQRFVTLYSLGTFRFVGDALNVITGDLSDAINRWQDDREQEEQTSADDSAQPRLNHDRRFIEELQNLTIDLTMLNSLVDRGIVSQSRTAEGSRENVLAHIKGIGHYELPGFMSLTGYLDRRYGGVVRTIGAIGRRYELLGKRIAELSALVEAKLQIDQEDRQYEQLKAQRNQLGEQQSLLKKVDRLTVFGMVYYAGQIITFALLGALALYHYEKWDAFKTDKAADQLKYLIYLPLFAIGVSLGSGALAEIGRDLKKRKLAMTIYAVVALAAVAILAALVIWGAPWMVHLME